MYTALVLIAALAAQPDPKDKPDAASALLKFAADATKPDDKDSPLRKLQKERARERASALQHMAVVIRIGNFDTNYYQQCIQTQIALAENLAELMDKSADKIKCYEMRLNAMKDMEKFIGSLVQAGKVRPQDLNLAKATRIDAEIELLKLKGPEANPAAGDDPEALIKQSIAEMKALTVALEKKEPEEKLKVAAQKLKVTLEKLKATKVPKGEDERLKLKYEKEVLEAAIQLGTATVKNPEGAKLIEEVLKSLGG